MYMSEKKGNSRGDGLFAAANSGRGFVSFYGEIFCGKDIERRYIIKGGPGTGKSGFLRRVASAAESCGRRVERYRCSSDPDSLDGVIIDGSISLIDGTAPHSADTDLPGARDEIVDLGAFWDSERLRLQRAEIESLAQGKGECYRRAYRYLEACECVFAGSRITLMPIVLHEKLARAAARCVRSMPRGEGFELRTALVDSVGMKGRARLEGIERSAERVHTVEDSYGTASLYLRALISEARLCDQPLRVSYDPIHLDEPNAVLFCHTGDCFVIGDGRTKNAHIGEGSRTVRMKRFLDNDGVKRHRASLRADGRMHDALVDSAIESLREAGQYHFELERIYSSCMDFEALSSFTQRFIEEKLLR